MEGETQNGQAHANQAVEDFLASPPAGTPPEVIELLASGKKLAETGLSPHLFFEAVEQAGVAISITDTRANILYANKSFNRITGYAAEEVVGKNEAVLSEKSTPRIVYETMWARLMQKKPWSGMLVNRRKDQSRYVADLLIVPVQNQQDETTHYLGMHRDITDMHRLELQVRNQKALIEAVVDAVPMAIAVLDRNGRVMIDNHEYKKLSADLRLSEPVEYFLAELGYAMREGGDLHRVSNEGFMGREVKYVSERGGKPRWFACSAVWFREHDVASETFFESNRDEHLLMVINETTRLKEQEEDMRRNAMRALMAEGELIQGMRETISGAMYQMQAPLNMVSAAVGMLLKREGPEVKQKQLYQVLEEAIRSGRKAMETLRTCMPKTPNETPCEIDLNAMMDDLLNVCRDQLERLGITLFWKADESLPKLTGNEAALRRMFKQLLDNAIEAMEDEKVTTRELHLSTAYLQSYCEVRIGDTGPGIPQAEQLKVFQPFYSTKADKGRGGMGLTMAQDVANQHAGMIVIDNDCPYGCCIQVRLPMAYMHEGGGI